MLTGEPGGVTRIGARGHCLSHMHCLSSGLFYTNSLIATGISYCCSSGLLLFFFIFLFFPTLLWRVTSSGEEVLFQDTDQGRDFQVIVVTPLSSRELIFSTCSYESDFDILFDKNTESERTRVSVCSKGACALWSECLCSLRLISVKKLGHEMTCLQRGPVLIMAVPPTWRPRQPPVASCPRIRCPDLMMHCETVKNWHDKSSFTEGPLSLHQTAAYHCVLACLVSIVSLCGDRDRKVFLHETAQRNTLEFLKLYLSFESPKVKCHSCLLYLTEGRYVYVYIHILYIYKCHSKSVALFKMLFFISSYESFIWRSCFQCAAFQF